MQEFRPASVVAADTALAERLIGDDHEAVRELVLRYGAAVTAIAPSAIEVFVEAWNRRSEFSPGDEFGAWLYALAVERAGSDDETIWSAVMATSVLEPGVHEHLRIVHVSEEGQAQPDLAEALHGEELRLERRLAHLGASSVVLAALAEPVAWTLADTDLGDRVMAAIAPKSEPRGDEDLAVAPSTVTRLLRPALFGLAAAAAVLVVAVVLLSALSGAPATPAFSAELTPTGLVADVEAGEIVVTERDSGIEIQLDATTLPRRSNGLYYEAVLLLRSGSMLSAGTFTEGNEVILWGGVELADVDGMQIVLGDLDVASESNDVVLKVDFPASTSS